MDDCLILGGGAIGLSLAYELACNGLRVRVVDQGQPGQAASWAGAGMLPPGSSAPNASALDRLAALSEQLYSQWAQTLREATGIDIGYRNCGAIYLARDAAAARELTKRMQAWQAGGIACDPLDEPARQDIEPTLLPPGDLVQQSLQAAYWVARESQIRNPRFVKALIAGCRRRGVRIDSGIHVHDFELQDRRVATVQSSMGRLEAGSYCLTAGAWSGALASRFGLNLPVKPIRGQIVLLAAEQASLGHIVNEGPRYLVPRGDGLILVGSTEEDVGFDTRTSAAGLASLLDFAVSLVPSLAAAPVEKSWAGLRPGSSDDMPFLGQVPGMKNLFVATGHFRHGLRLAPATAQLMGQLIRGIEPEFDLSEFRPDRHG